VKEGDVMKEKNVFDVLENTDTSVIDRLSAEFPPQDDKEKERIFNMSERKFNNKMNNISKADDQSVSGVEIYKKPKWRRFLSIAAVFAVVAVGITGGSFALRHLNGNNNISAGSTDENNTATDAENSTETPTEPANVSNCPFDFAAHDFYFPDRDSRTHIDIILGETDEELGKGETRISISDGKVIPVEKRQKLAEFFNSCNWEEVDGYVYYPEWLATYEQRGLFCIEDNEAYIIALNKDTNTLSFSQLQIKLEYDSDTDENYSDQEERFVNYRAIGDFASDEPGGKTYRIDYDLFMSKMKEILGDDFRELPLDTLSFHNKEWRIATDENMSVESLSTDDKNALYELFRKCSWKEGEQSNERLSTSEAMEIYENTPPAESDKYVILTCYYYDYHDIIYFEQYDDKTVVRHYDYGVQGENVPDAEYRVNIYNHTCDDADLVPKIKECLSSNNSEEVPVDISFIDEVNWLYTSADTRAFDITQDKMKRIGECLQKYNWSMIDENHSFGYDICVVGEWKNYLADLKIGKDWDENGNTIIMFRISEPTDVAGKKYPGSAIDSALEFSGKKYISSDKNAYSELEKILSE